LTTWRREKSENSINSRSKRQRVEALLAYVVTSGGGGGGGGVGGGGGGGGGGWGGSQKGSFSLLDGPPGFYLPRKKASRKEIEVEGDRETPQDFPGPWWGEKEKTR